MNKIGYDTFSLKPPFEKQIDVGCKNTINFYTTKQNVKKNRYGIFLSSYAPELSGIAVSAIRFKLY